MNPTPMSLAPVHEKLDAILARLDDSTPAFRPRPPTPKQITAMGKKAKPLPYRPKKPTIPPGAKIKQF